MTRDCELAGVDEVTASYYPGMLTIRASGTVPESCWEIKIRQAPMAIWPPEFAIERCRTDEICLTVVRNYSIERGFPTYSIPERVVIHDDQGRREVDVDVQPDAAAPGSGDRPFVGHSDVLSYDAALRNAVDQVPISSKPDQGYFRFTVTEVSGQVGGIANLQRLSVTIETQD